MLQHRWVVFLLSWSLIYADLPPLSAGDIALHLYTVDGQPDPHWDLPDFQVTWHRSEDLTPQWRAYRVPLVAHYQGKNGWRYSSHTRSPREFRAEYRKRLGLKGTPGHRTLVWIHAEACAPCQRMQPHMAEVAKLCTLEDTLWDWGEPGEFGTQAVPHTLLLDADNRVVQQWTGYVDFHTLKRSIEE